MSQFIHLPTDILFYYFNSNFTLSELFHLRVLNSHIQSLIEYCFRTRKSLKLFWSFREIEHYATQLYRDMLEDDASLRLKNHSSDDLTLVRSKLCHATVDRLAQLFPALEHLLIFTSHTHYGSLRSNKPLHAEHYPHFPYLISRWPKLRHLSLFGMFNQLRGTKIQLVGQICAAISELHCLKRLDLCSPSMFNYKDLRYVHSSIPIEIDSRILFQLERFYWSQWAYDEKEQVQMMRKLGPNCTRLHINFVIYYNPHNDEIAYQTLDHYRKSLLPSSPSMRKSATAGGITHLTIHLTFHHRNGAALEHIAQFTQLYSLRMQHCLEKDPQRNEDPSTMPITAILPTLIKLVRLTDLWLSGFQLDPLRNVVKLPALHTVRHLTIEPSWALTNSCPSALILTQLGHIFPSIRSFCLKQRCLPAFDPTSHLSQFAHLTRFKLWIYQSHLNNPLMLSRQHRLRYEKLWGGLTWRDQIGPEEGQYGKQVWRRESSCTVQNSEQMSNLWIKDDALVWHWYKGYSSIAYNAIEY